MQIKNEKICLKYYEALDTFLQVRICHEQEITEFFEKSQSISRENYLSTLIAHCYPEYDEKIKAHIEALQNHSDPMILEEMKEDLYQLCLQVNPQLNISHVSLAMETETDTEGSHVIDFWEGLSLKEIRQSLKKEIIGQDEAVESLCKSLQRSAIGLNDENRPIGSFMFVGNTGVGKTQLTKTLAKLLFEKSDSLIRIDCSEYSQPHECAKLIGAPPGYVGHETGGVLTEAIKKQPRAVVLFDEIEKADGKVHNMLLQILDEGLLTDSQGSSVSFSDCLIIMTSNLGLKDLMLAEKAPGFAKVTGGHLNHNDSKNTVDNALREFFSPEFLNRVDNILHFKDLSEKDCLLISENFLKQTQERVSRKGFDIAFSHGVARKIVELGYDPRFGAREIKRQILKFVETPLSDEILEGKILKGSFYEADISNDKIKFKRQA